MANWNKKIGLSVLSLGLLAMTPNVASADDCYTSDCFDPCSLGGFEVGVDFIYWKPCYDNTEWGVRLNRESSTLPTVDTFESNYAAICPSWEPGVRVRVAKNDIFCDWTLSGSYTWIHSKDSQGIAAVGTVGSSSDYVTSPLFGPGIADFGDQFFFTFGDASWKSNYQTWDVLLSYDFECNRCSTFTPFFGVEGLILSQQLDAAFGLVGFNDVDDSDDDNLPLTNEAAVAWKSSYFGVGLKLGTDYTFNLFDCLKLFARASGSIVVGDNDTSNHQVYHIGSGTGNASVTRYGRYKDDTCCLIVPGYHIQLGVQYDNNWCGTDVALRLGWEFVQWFNIANPRTYGYTGSDYAIQASSGSTSTIGYNGLIAGLDVRF